MQAICCHCSICRKSAGAPFLMIGMWDPAKTRIVAGKTVERPTSGYLTRNRCPDCGAAIFNAVRSEKLSTNNFTLPLLAVRDEHTRPTHHIYYADRVIDIEDGLPKFDRFKWLPRA